MHQDQSTPSPLLSIGSGLHQRVRRAPLEVRAHAARPAQELAGPPTSVVRAFEVGRAIIVQVITAKPQHLDDLARLRRVKDRIDRDYAQPLDVEALAREAHLSAGHLTRRFKAAYGESPYSYLMTRRIERAMSLLRMGDRTVTEVCFEVGCSSLGTFSTRFTELVGMPPSAYRRADESIAGIPSCVAKQVTKPVRNREVPVTESQLV
jgi:AraC-like DNA-binding protein